MPKDIKTIEFKNSNEIKLLDKSSTSKIPNIIPIKQDFTNYITP